MQEIFEMRSSTSAVRAFPVGLSNDSGCHHKIQAKDCFLFFFFERQLTSTPLSTIILYSCLHSMLTQIGHAISCLDTLPCALSSAWNALLGMLSIGEILSTQHWSLSTLSPNTWYMPLNMYLPHWTTMIY